MSALPHPSSCRPFALRRLRDRAERAEGFGPRPGETTAILSWDGTGEATLREVAAGYRGSVATLTSDPRLDPSRTVGEHLEGRHRVDEIADSLGLAGLGRQRVGELDAAMRHRVELCRELASTVELIAAFDPYVRLGERDARMLQVVLRAAAVECGRTVVYATSDAHTASRAHRAIVVRRGRIVADVRGASAPELARRLL